MRSLHTISLLLGMELNNGEGWREISPIDAKWVDCIYKNVKGIRICTRFDVLSPKHAIFLLYMQWYAYLSDEKLGHYVHFLKIMFR